MILPTSELTDVLTVRPFEGSGAYGPVYGAAYSATVYAEPGIKRVSDSAGREVVANLMIIAPPAVSLTVGDEATYEGRRYEVIDSQALHSRGVAHHSEVYLKSLGPER